MEPSWAVIRTHTAQRSQTEHSQHTEEWVIEAFLRNSCVEKVYFYGNLVSFEEMCYRSKCVEFMNGITRSHAISTYLRVQTDLVRRHISLLFTSYMNFGNSTSLSFHFFFFTHNMLAAMSGRILVASNGMAVWNWQHCVCLKSLVTSHSLGPLLSMT